MKPAERPPEEWLVKSILPPWLSTMRLVMARPSPEPTEPRALSPCAKGENNTGISDSGMPLP